ncbi:hypothetical protein B9W68_23335 [Streptomyces sp. CS227]|uniref:amino acid permease n=1 Tax=Streptomyces sp. CS227 TaxID=1982763 RepID=UPI000B6DB430|nr:hypothetical protein B9W68_23335 [Streptomyces sp. CS227]
MAAVLACAFAAFTGFESTAIYRREARGPHRTIPRATFIAVAFLGLFYAFIVWTVIQAYGSDKVVQAATDDAGGLFFAAITTYVGAWAADLMHVLIVSSVVASLLAFHNALNRYILSLTEEGLLPPVLGRIHPRHRSPYLAGAAQTAVGAVVVAGFALAGADPYTQLLLWVNTPGMIGLMALQLLAAAAVLRYFRRVRHREGVWRTVVAPVAAVLLLGAAIALVTANVELFSGAGTGTNILPGARGRHRIEHIETVPDDQLPRFAELGVAASMQPPHTAYTRADHSDAWSRRLGPERAGRAWRIRELREAGAYVALGSDWPIAHHDARQVLALAQEPRGAASRGGGLSALMALEGVTSHAAAAAGEAAVAGRIAPGHRADLTAFAADPLTTPAGELPETPIALTVVGCSVRHRAV